MDDTTLLLIGAGVLGFLFLRGKGVIGTPTGVVWGGTPKIGATRYTPPPGFNTGAKHTKVYPPGTKYVYTATGWKAFPPGSAGGTGLGPYGSGSLMMKPKVTVWNFPCPTSGKMLQEEMEFAKEHNIYLDPNTLPSAIKKKLNITGIESPSHLIV